MLGWSMQKWAALSQMEPAFQHNLNECAFGSYNRRSCTIFYFYTDLYIDFPFMNSSRVSLLNNYCVIQTLHVLYV